MHTVASRAGRLQLALGLAATMALGACADEPVAPKTPLAPASNWRSSSIRIRR
jgi:hypothetical protein